MLILVMQITNLYGGGKQISPVVNFIYFPCDMLARDIFVYHFICLRDSAIERTCLEFNSRWLSFLGVVRDREGV